MLLLFNGGKYVSSLKSVVIKKIDSDYTVETCLHTNTYWL